MKANSKVVDFSLSNPNAQYQVTGEMNYAHIGEEHSIIKKKKRTLCTWRRMNESRNNYAVKKKLNKYI